MSVNTNTNVAENVEKVKSVALEVPVPAEIVTLEIIETRREVAVLTIAENDAQAYGQLLLLTKAAKNIKFVGGSKAGMLLIPSTIENIELIKQYVNSAFDAAMLIVHVTYGDYAKLRISIKNMGGGTAKKSERASFYDRDLNGVIMYDETQYIFGEGKVNDEVQFSKYNNTLIARLVKNIFADHRLYSDEDKTGFHKFLSRMPKDDLVRTNDNYAFYIKWDEVEAKIDAFNAANPDAENKISGKETVAKILEIIAAVYPGVEISTGTPLVLECLKSDFASISREKFVIENGAIVSKLEILAAEKLQKKLEREQLKAANDEKKKAEKAAKVIKDADVSPVAPAINLDAAPVVPGIVTPGAPVTPVAPVAPVAPVTPVAPVAPVAPVGLGSASGMVVETIGVPNIKM